MKGFLNGVAVLVVVGQLSNVTGYDASGETKLAKALDTALHLALWQPVVVVTTLVTVALILVLARTPLSNFAMLLALVVVSAAVALLGVEVPLVSSISEIPGGLPMPGLPSLAVVPKLVLPALSVALIGLVQGGGISKAYPNPDGRYPDASRDMIGQGIGNAVGAAFGGMPIGASVSSTAMVATSGATSRLANVMIGAVIAVVLLLLGPLVEMVPLSVLGGILLVVGFSAFDIAGMRDVWNASRESAVIMAITLGAMLLVPVQYAVLLGAALSGLQFVYSSSKDVRVVELVQTSDGHWSEQAPPAVLPSEAVTVVDIYGSVFYAGVDRVDALLPSVADAVRPCLVVRMRGRSEIGSTALMMLRHYHELIVAADGRLILAGVEESLLARLRATGFVDELGADNVLPKSDIVYASTEAAKAAGERWLEQTQTRVGE
jgi:SulP family sulfate permease